MNEKFFDLKKEKQNRIINSALQRFALEGFKDAGTDEMVGEAGISKGLLFHYFGSKIGLYAFVHEYAVRYLLVEADGCLQRGEINPFAIAKQGLKAAAQAMETYPYLVYFLYQTKREKSQEAKEAAAPSMQMMQQLHADLKLRADFSVFADAQQADRVWNMIDNCVYALLVKMLFAPLPFKAEAFYEEICAQIDLLEAAVISSADKPDQPDSRP